MDIDRIMSIEEKLKVSLFQIEKRLVALESKLSSEDRIQELEDLILLLQVEVSKLRAIPETVPDNLRDRLEFIEEAIREKPVMKLGNEENLRIADLEAYMERVSELENRLMSMEGLPESKQIPRVEEKTEIKGVMQSKITYLEKELADIDDRLKEIEIHPIDVSGVKSEEEKPSDILNEVKKILGEFNDTERY